MTGRIHPLLLHLAGCVLFLSLPILFSPESLTLRSYLTNPPTQRDLIVYLLVLGVFYANYFHFIPAYCFTRKYVAFILLNAAGFAGLILLPFLFTPRSAFPFPRHNPPAASYPAQPGSPPGNRPPAPNPSAPSPDAPGNPFPPNTPSGNRPPSSNDFANPSTPSPSDLANPSALPPNAFANPSAPSPDAPSRNTPADFPSGPQHHPFRIRDLSQNLFLFLVVLFLALLLKVRDRWVRAEEEKLHAELAYLKAQVNPHFLFNILNSIYALALERSDRTAGAIVKLSSMMRYVLLEAGRDRVPLEQEIAYLTDYISLQQTRFEDALRLDFTVTGRSEGKTIAPLLLIPFVENAFKHGVNPEQPSAIHIRIDIGDTGLRLQVTNKKVTVQNGPATPAGLGIGNTRQRLGILYPGRHTLSIADGADDFEVSLTLHLT